ncbi:MAG: glycosyltransferase family 2 protein [Pseudomonadota bacterium]
MTDHPLVSVVMPAYNSADFILESLHSVFSQSYGNTEVIVVDDGSTDSTPDVLRRLGDRVRVINQRNAGAPAARNRGIQAAKGQYIAFIDSDDIWHHDKLRLQVEHLQQNPGVAMACARWHVWHAESNGDYVVPDDFEQPINSGTLDSARSGWVYTQLLLDCIVWTTTVLLRRDVVEECGLFDTDLTSGQDYDYWFRVSRVGKIDQFSENLALYRIRPQSLARTVHKRNFQYEVVKRALDKWGTQGPDGSALPDRELRKRVTHLLVSYAYRQSHFGEPKIAVKGSLEAIRYAPFNISAWKYLLMSLARLFIPKQQGITGG